MAVGKIMVSAGMPGLKELVDNLGRILPPEAKMVILAEALEKAIQPAFRRLYETTPVGPTGNLRAARTYKIAKYPPGVAVAILGYQRTGKEKAVSAAGGSVQVAVGNSPDRAFHQWWLERGTKPRIVNKAVPAKAYTRRGYAKGGFQRREYTMTRNGKTFSVRAHEISGHAVASHEVKEFSAGAYYYASSFRRLGPFKINSPDGRTVQTDPPYFRAFFKKSKNPIQIPPMHVGGFAGRPPLETAWRDTQSTVAEYLQRELSVSLDQALEALTYTSTGTVG